MLDTDTCIALIRRQPEKALRRLQSKGASQVGISTVTLSELAYGAARSSRSEQASQALQEFLLPLEIAAYDECAALEYGSVRAALMASGLPIGPLDTLIAAHARSLDLVLVTHNTREFSRVPKLRIDDWLAA